MLALSDIETTRVGSSLAAVDRQREGEAVGRRDVDDALVAGGSRVRELGGRVERGANDRDRVVVDLRASIARGGVRRARRVAVRRRRCRRRRRRRRAPASAAPDPGSRRSSASASARSRARPPPRRSSACSRRARNFCPVASGVMSWPRLPFDPSPSITQRLDGEHAIAAAERRRRVVDDLLFRSWRYCTRRRRPSPGRGVMRFMRRSLVPSETINCNDGTRGIRRNASLDVDAR